MNEMMKVRLQDKVEIVEWSDDADSLMDVPGDGYPEGVSALRNNKNNSSNGQNGFLLLNFSGNCESAVSFAASFR